MRTLNLLALLGFLTAGLCFAQEPPRPPAPKAPSDVLTFTNGDKLTGRLGSVSGGNVNFHSDMAGDLTIPFEKVKELRSEGQFVALRVEKPGHYKPAATGAVAFENDQVTLTPTTGNNAGTPQTFAPKDLGFLIDLPTYTKEIDHHPGLRRGWSGLATAGFTLVRSTQSATTFTAALNVVRTIPTVAYLPKDTRTSINVTETYGTNTSPVIPPTIPPSPAVIVKTSIFHADAEFDKYFSPRLYALVDTSFDHNFASGLQFQQVYGGGIGWTPIEDNKQELDLKAELHYERQQFLQTAGAAPPMNTQLIGSTFQENYFRNLPHKIVFTEWANYLPAWNQTVAYSANAYVGLLMPVYKRLNISLSSTDNYLNNPAQFYRTNTVQLVTGVSYSFK